ncbi:MAG: hypothetical protein U1E52_08230 [Geminicoccaceae bacterium]
MAALIPTLAASAADLAPEGKIDVTWTYRYAPLSMPTDNGQDFMTGEAEVVLIGNSPGSLLDHLGGRCMMSGPMDSKSGAFKLIGRCTYKDSDGDMIFATDEEIGTSFAEPARGIGKFVGGTGKYGGITGGYDYTDDFSVEINPGVFGGGGVKKGSYKIVR